MSLQPIDNPAAYIESLPAAQRPAIAALRELILANLPAGYEETLAYGILSYSIPLERYPHTYNKQPLTYLSLAAQKNYCSLHLMSVYMNPEREAWLREEFRKAGKRIDLGKACLRFKRLEDLPLAVIAEFVAGTPPEAFIAAYEKAQATRGKR